MRYNAFYYGMSIMDFNSSTIGEVITWVHAKQKAKDNSQRNFAEMMRWLGALVANMFSGKKRIKPTDLFTFPDEDNKPKNTTRALTEQDKIIFEKMQKAALRHGNNR